MDSEAPYGVWDTTGVWYPNPFLCVPAQEQRQRNIRDGYLKPGDPIAGMQLDPVCEGRRIDHKVICSRCGLRWGARDKVPAACERRAPE